MGECLITRRGGEPYELPILSADYPKDVSLTVIKGKTVSATFSVSIATPGKPAEYTYQWYKDGTAVEGATASSYTISGLGTNASHNIYCSVTNKAGTVTTRTAKLKVEQLYTPTLNASYPADVSTSKSLSTTFKVQIATDGNPASYTYQWYVNGTAVSGATSSSYSMLATEIGTKTVYCKVTNSAGTVQSRTATLTVTKLYLYNRGDLCSSVSGGWGAYSLDTYWVLGTVTLKSDHMYILADYHGATYALTKKTVDLTLFNKLTVVHDNYLINSVGVSKTNQKVSSGGFSAGNWTINGTIMTVDVSALSGGYYVGACAGKNEQHSQSAKIYEVYLE